MAEPDSADRARTASARQAHEALARALRPAPDDDEHVSFETLEAHVDGRLDAPDRDVLQSHLEGCPQCAADLADLEAVRADLDRVRPEGQARRSTRRWRAVAMIGSAAALLVIGIWIGRRPPDAEPSRQASLDARPTPAPVRPAEVLAADQGALGLELLTESERRTVTEAIAARHLDVPAAVRGLAGGAGTLLGAAGSAPTPVPTAPVGTAVSVTRPMFRWTGVPGATAYSVAVYDERYAEIARSPRVTGTDWTPAADLPRGVICSWQITIHLPAGDVTGPAPPQPEARFVVLDAAAAAAAAAQRSRLAGDPLALGILLARAGLLADAADALARAAGSADPTTADTARALLGQLREVGRPR